MKKKLAVLLTVSAMVTSLLTGCGSSKLTGGTTPKDIIDSSNPVIGYLIQNPEKDEVPGAVVIFQEGKATWYDDTEYTMGDFSKMADDEVITNLSGEIAAENNKQIEDYEAQIEEYQEKINTLNDSTYTFAWSDYITKILIAYENQNATGLNDDQYSIISWLEVYYSSQLDENGTLEDAWNEYVKENPDEDVFRTIGSDDKSILAAVKVYDVLARQYSDAASGERDAYKASIISENQTEIDRLNEQILELQSATTTGEEYKTVIDIKTDESGNDVGIEAILLMGKEELFMGLPLNSYAMDYIINGTKIYDSTYYGYSMTDGEAGIGFLFFRDSSGSGITLKFDDLDTDGVFVDVEDESEFLK